MPCRAGDALRAQLFQLCSRKGLAPSRGRELATSKQCRVGAGNFAEGFVSCSLPLLQQGESLSGSS